MIMKIFSIRLLRGEICHGGYIQVSFVTYNPANRADRQDEIGNDNLRLRLFLLNIHRQIRTKRGGACTAFGTQENNKQTVLFDFFLYNFSRSSRTEDPSEAFFQQDNRS